MTVLAQWAKEHKPVQMLQHDVKSDRLAHAYILIGSLDRAQFCAMDLAKRLMCLEAPGDGCGSCVICVQITLDQCVDFVTVRPSGKARYIKMEDVHNLLETVQTKPMVSNKRVCFLENVQFFDKEAANSFLKTLEEPPSATVFILCTPNVHSVLDTIVSRCRRVHLGSDEKAWSMTDYQDDMQDVIEDLLDLFRFRKENAVGLCVDRIQERVQRLRGDDKGSKEFLDEMLKVLLLLLRDVQVFLQTDGHEELLLWKEKKDVVREAVRHVNSQMLLDIELRIYDLRKHINYNMNLKTALSYVLAPLSQC